MCDFFQPEAMQSIAAPGGRVRYIDTAALGRQNVLQHAELSMQSYWMRRDSLNRSNLHAPLCASMGLGVRICSIDN